MSVAYAVTAVVVVILAHFFDDVSTAAIENFAGGMFDAMYTRFAVSLLQLFALGVLVLEGLTATGFQFGDVYTQVVASLSVVGGLACQNSLSNIAAGAQLIITRPFEIGDCITAAGVTGTVKRLDFFHTRLVTVGGEGINIPNSSILGGALTNCSDNYDHADSSGLRVVNVPLRVPISTDLEKAEKALAKAAKAMDAFTQELNADKTKRNYANGTHTLAEYHKLKYKSELSGEQAANPSGVFVGGQVLGHMESGLDLTLYCYCDNMLFNTVKQQAFRQAVKCLKEVGITLC
jgi:hypothetical protein